MWYSLVYAVLATAWMVVSDQLVEMMGIDGASLARAQTAKALLFVGMSSLLIYGILKRRARERDGERLPPVSVCDIDWLPPVLALTMLAMALGGFGWAVYHSAKRSITQSTYDQLASIARLKEQQVQSWLQERREDVDRMVNTPLLVAEVRGWLAGGARDAVRERRILDQLHHIAASPRYREVILHSAEDGRMLLATAPHVDSERVRERVLEAAAVGHSVVDDFYPLQHRGEALAIDMFGAIGEAGRSGALAVVHLVVEPSDLFEPLLNGWPAPGLADETVLMRREGNEILLVNARGFVGDVRRYPRVAFGDPGLVATQVLAGHSGPVSGRDYGGTPVLAYGLPIEGTPWFIVAKAAQSEAYATLNAFTVATAMMAFVLMLLSWWWWWERNRESALRHRDQLERAVLAKRLDYLARYTSDGVMMLDPKGTITDVNGRCLALHGYQREEMLGLNVAMLGVRPLGEAFPLFLQRLLKDGSLTYEGEHRRHDGSLLPVEVGARVVDLEGERGIQLICRDITSRVQAERAIRERENLFDEFFHASPAGMFMLDRELRYLRVNEPLARMHGVPVGAHNGRALREILPRFAPVLEPMLREVLEQGQLVLTTEVSGETPRWPGVEQHWILALFSIAASGARSAALGGVVVDISRRKKAEARILALSRLYATMSATNQAIVRGGTLREVLAEVCRACVCHGGFRLAWIGLADHHAGGIVPTEAHGEALDFLDGLVVRTGAEEPDGPTATAYREQRVCVCNDLANTPWQTPWGERAASRGLRSAIALPLRCNGQLSGALTVYGGERDIFDDEVVALLTEMADNVSFAMDHFARERLRREAEAALRQSETRLREAQAVGRIGSWEIDVATWAFSASPELFRLYERDPALGAPPLEQLLENYAPESAERMREATRRAIISGERVELEQEVRLPSGRSAWHITSIVPERDVTGWTIMLRGTTQDITERKEAEMAAALYAAEVEDLYQHAPCGYHSLDADGRFCLINDTELQWLGYTREELIGRARLVDLVSPETRPSYTAHFEQLERTGHSRDCELDLMCKDGSLLPILLSATVVLDGEGRFAMSRASIYDMTERKKMERERAEHARRLAEMSRNLVAIQEEERRRLAGLLHERASPNLAAIRIGLDMIATELRPLGLDETEDRLDDTLALLEDTTLGVRQICTELRPALLDYAGLGPAVDSFAQQFSRRTGIQVRVDFEGGRSRLAADVESTLFRIVQEALTNCAKHSDARSIEIKLSVGGHGAVLTIADDGVGFDPNGLGGVGKTPGLGLLTMRERAEFAGGRFHILSRPGGGATIRVQIAGCDEVAVAAEV